VEEKAFDCGGLAEAKVLLAGIAFKARTAIDEFSARAFSSM
jgi:hypothetical protein